MKKTAYIYDLSRLASRRYQSTPTGIDRIDIQFSNEVLKKLPESCHFVIYVFGKLELVSPTVAKSLIKELFSRWECSETANYAIAKKIDLLLLAPNFSYQNYNQNNRIISPSKFIYHLQKYLSYFLTACSYLKGKYFLSHKQKIDKSLKGIFSKNQCRYLCFSHSGFGKDAHFSDYCKEFDLEVIAYIHDLIPIEYPQYCKPKPAKKFKLFIDQILNTSPLLLTNSNATQSSLQKYIKEHDNKKIHTQKFEMHTIYPGVSVLEPNPIFTPPKKPYFVMLGTIEPRKDHALILDVWETLIKGKDAPTLYIMGKRGWLNTKLFARLDDLKKQTNKIIEINDANSQEVTNLLAHANAMLFPSRCEGFGIPALEAASLNTQVIASDLAVFRELDNGIFIYPDGINNKNSWLKAIKSLTVNQVASTEASTLEFEWENSFEKLWHIINEK